MIVKSSNEYVYDQVGWDALIEHNLCGDWDLLVWGSSSDEPCERSIVHDASLLQTSCMHDYHGDLDGALGCMLEREFLYDLMHNTILVYYQGAKYYWLWQECYNYEYVDGLPGMYSFYAGA